MAEFERKKRYVSYNDSKCKMYLRNDFNRKCAYCLIREGDLGSPDNFEKDHFFPQKGQAGVGKVHSKYDGEVFNVDNYYNLYYSCKRCNGSGGKSNTWSPTLLDPCVDDIWGKHIRCNLDNIIEYSTIQGEEYIGTFKLNSKSALNIRKAIAESQNDIKRHLFELENLLTKANDEHMIKFLNAEKKRDLEKLEYGSKYDVHFTYLDENYIKEAEQILSNYSICFESGDFELDYSILFNNIRYAVKLELENGITFNKQGEKRFYLPYPQIKDWLGKRVIVCHYDYVNKNLYFCILDDIIDAKSFINGSHRFDYNISIANKL